MRLYCLQEQEDMIRRHHEELRSLHEKLNLHTDTSLDHFRQTALVSSGILLHILTEKDGWKVFNAAACSSVFSASPRS